MGLAEASPSERGDKLKVKDLAVTKDATDVEYNAVVEHVLFKSKSNTKAVCAELTANLKAQGWTKEGSDLITPASSILKRKRGAAALTIFVKPDGAGARCRSSPRASPGTKSRRRNGPNQSQFFGPDLQ